METQGIKTATIYNAPAPHMVGDGFRVHNFFPSGYKLKMSPFFLLDYNAKLEFSATEQKRGVGVHPHRGFETVTIAYHGAVAHHDSAGNSGVIYPGDVQWMTAGSGILHKEYHDDSFAKTGGTFQMVQLWVNLPAKFKMSAPKYQAISGTKTPTVNLGNGAKIALIAGEIHGITGAASTFSPMDVYNLHLEAGGQAILHFKEGFNTVILAIDGETEVNGEAFAENQLAALSADGDHITITASKASTVLVLSGQPINEPIAQYGPFLMNRPEEIQQAIEDYNTGKFGYLED